MMIIAHKSICRYFIVFDDMWEQTTWDIIQLAMSRNNCGSRVITTTRIHDVGFSSSSCERYFYRLKPLSELHSRELFYRRLFNPEEDCPIELEKIYHEILKKCGGLPLAIIAISGLLAHKRSTKDQPFHVLNSIGGKETSYLEALRNVISLSYYDLPHQLKTCLLYLSVFPEGYIIKKQDLIRRWIAEGFIHKEDGYTKHELGEKYFHELINRGLIHPEKTDKYYNVRSCHVHDVVLDFIIWKSIEENFVTFAGTLGSDITPQSKVRRLSLQAGEQGNNNLPMGVVFSHTRSLNVFGNSAEIPCLDEFLHLHVLNFRGCNRLLNHHLENVSRLFQLRYLNLRDTRVSELPEEIGHLECLEMLDLRGTDVLELPAAIVNLRKLVHLLTDCGVKFPDGIAKMQALEVLKHVRAFKQSFNFLQELGQLKNLRKLHLNFDGFAAGDTTRVRQWMELWSPTSSLQKLMTWNSVIPWVPNWVGSLINLQQLRLEVERVSQKDLCILGGLASLLILDLIGTAKSEDRLTVNDGVGFPCLRQFCYDILDGGMNLTFASGSMPKLENLMIYFDAAETKSLTNDSFDFGIENLPCLTFVKLGVLGSVESAVEAVKAAIERAASAHPNHPSVCFKYIYLS
jgi:disease resistance protein RPM1